MKNDKYIYIENLVGGGLGKSSIRLLQYICNWWRTIPCQLAFCCSKHKDLVLSDFGSYKNMVRTLVFAKHNRNLFYHRMGRTSILYSWILPGEYSLKLPFSCKLGKHIMFVHNDTCHLNANAIGDNFICYPHVVLGSKNLLDNAKPTIGDNVTIGTGAVVVGNVHIGNNVSIGANSVVITDIPDNHIVFGNPAITKPIKK